MLLKLVYGRPFQMNKLRRSAKFYKYNNEHYIIQENIIVIRSLEVRMYYADAYVGLFCLFILRRAINYLLVYYEVDVMGGGSKNYPHALNNVTVMKHLLDSALLSN